jgi:hypothetical protein
MDKKNNADRVGGVSETVKKPSTELDEWLYGKEPPNWYEIPPPTPDEMLDDFFRVFYEVRPAKGDRVAYIVALQIISIFLLSSGIINRECSSWLSRLCPALEDLDAGVVWPVFQPAQIKHRKRSPSYIQYRRACIAAGVKALIRSGVARLDAAKQAIREVKSIAGTSPETVLSWMDEFGKKRGANSRGASDYKAIKLLDLSKCRSRAEFRRAAAHCFWNANRPIVY